MTDSFDILSLPVVLHSRNDAPEDECRLGDPFIFRGRVIELVKVAQSFSCNGCEFGSAGDCTDQNDRIPAVKCWGGVFVEYHND